jgi:hypothetical protein
MEPGGCWYTNKYGPERATTAPHTTGSTLTPRVGGTTDADGGTVELYHHQPTGRLLKDAQTMGL